MQTHEDGAEEVIAVALFTFDESEAPEYFRELFTGPPEESDEQRAARVAVAGEVLTELLEEGAVDGIAMEDARFAARLIGIALLRSVVSPPRQPNRPGQSTERAA